MKLRISVNMLKMLNMFLPLIFLIRTSYGENTMVCPRLVRTFSATSFNQSYFECGKEGDTPVLKDCPEGELYWPSKEMCVAHPRGKNVAQHNELRRYKAPVLGRNVYLGCLFDAKRNQIMPQESFWKQSTVKENKMTSVSYASDVSFYAAQSTYERLSHMDVSASLKLEFLGGLVSVEGSAAYLKDTVESENTVAFVMKAHYTTRYEALPTHTKIDYDDVCRIRDATHVVSAITYGMDAFFVFKKTATVREDREKIKGSLKVAVDAIPSLRIDGGSKVIITGDLKEKIKGINAKLRGDFVLDVQPTTYNESVLVFKTLTKHLGKKPEYADASKMTMMLTPITRFCDASTAILIDISQTLIHSVNGMLREIEQIKLKAKTLQLTNVVQSYLPLMKMISMFSRRLETFELEIKSELQTILPKIRGGRTGSGEKDLIALLTKYKMSPFYYETSIAFLKTRHREIEVLEAILNPDVFKGTHVKVVDYEDALDIKTLFKKKLVLLLKFNILPNVSIVEKFLQGKKVDESKSWFNRQKVISTMGKTFRNFMKFAAANTQSDDRGSLIAVYNAADIYVNVYAVKNQDKLTDFTFPDEEPKMVTRSITYNSATFNVERPHNRWVTGFVVRFWKFGREHDAVERYFEFKGKGINTYEVTDLMPNQVYVFTIKYVTEMGSSPYGSDMPIVVMKPCSAPSNVQSTNVSSKSFTISWDLPLHIGEGVDIADYKVAVKKGEQLVKKAEKTGNHRNINFDGLTAATIYNVSIQAIAKTQTYNGTKGKKKVTPASTKAWFSCVTSPHSPSQLIHVAVSYHSVQLVWTAPTIAVGAVVQEYLVRYILVNNLGNTDISGYMEQSSGTNTSISINDLVQGSTYHISVKIVTSMGTSAYSSDMTVKTMFKETELDSLRHSVEQEIKHSVAASTSKLDAKISDVQINLENSIGSVRSSTSDLKGVVDVLDKKVSASTSKLDTKIIDQTKRIGDVKTTVENSISSVRSSISSVSSRVRTLEQTVSGRLRDLEREKKRLQEETCVERNVWYDGHDLKQEYVSSWRECSKLCANYGPCHGWTWDSDDWQCWMKDSDWHSGYKGIHRDRISGSYTCYP